jgi:hypothetical protein
MISEADIKFPDIPFIKTAALILVGLGIYFTYLYMVGFGSIKEALATTNYLFILAAFIMALIANVFHAAGWWVLLKEMGYKIRLSRAYQIYLACIFFVNLIPSAAVSGEVAKIYFIQKSVPGTRFDKILAAGLLSRLLEIVPVALGAIIGVAYLALYFNIPLWALMFCALIAFGIAAAAALVLAISLNKGLLRKITASIVRLLHKVTKGKGLDERLEHLDAVVCQFDESLRYITGNKKLIIMSLALIIAAFICDVSVAYIAFMAIGTAVSPGVIMTIFSIMVILQLLPTFLPGGVGLVDIVMTMLYRSMGVPSIQAAGATILIRLVTLWFLTATGGFMTLYLARHVEKMASNGK